VEIHRARVMERLGAHTVPEAVMAAASAGLRPLRSRLGGSGNAA
jgi:DNA-binding NarL/FixJ family response regulator